MHLTLKDRYIPIEARKALRINYGENKVNLGYFARIASKVLSYRSKDC